MDDLPLDLLRSFVAIAEAGTMARASARVHRTASALSLQMRRLSDAAGRPLFRRDGRRVALSEAGAGLLPHAREVLAASARARDAVRGVVLEGPVRFGAVQDFAEGPLAAALAAFAARHPDVRLEVRVAGSADLRARADAGELDLALVFVARSRRALLREPMIWLGDPALAARDPVPLVVLDPPCPFRTAALAALRRAGRRTFPALTTPSLSALRAAVAAGLGVGCRTARSAGGLPTIAGGLPPLGEIAWDLHVPRPLGPGARHLAAEVRAALRGG